jgi:hypothetical protein
VNKQDPNFPSTLHSPPPHLIPDSQNKNRYTNSDYLKKLGVEIAGFIFYLFELYIFLHPSKYGYVIDSELTYYIYLCRFVFLLFALPLFYLFRIAYYFDLEDALTHFLSVIYDFDNKNGFLQVKVFYYGIYVILSILLLLQAVDWVFGSFHLK